MCSAKQGCSRRRPSGTCSSANGLPSSDPVIGKISDACNALYQYMLIMTETTFRVPSGKQKMYFNRTMHQSMIWVMDKYFQARLQSNGSGR